MIIRISQASIHTTRIKALIKDTPNSHDSAVHPIVNRLMKPIRKTTIIIQSHWIYACVLLQFVDLTNHIIPKALPEAKFKLVVKDN